VMLADPRNWGQPLMVGGPAVQQVLEERRKAAETIAKATQKFNEIQSLTPEGQLKKIVKQELAKQQNKDIVMGDPPSPAQQAANQLAEQAIDAAIDEAAKAASQGTQDAPKTPRAARREAMRQAGIPTSQQPESQTSVKTPEGEPAGRQYTLALHKI